MPKDFKNEEHGLRKLRVATRNGVIFASYSDEVEALEEYLTPDILADFDTVFPGKLKIHGYYRNELPCNWKMYHENLKDPTTPPCCIRSWWCSACWWRATSPPCWSTRCTAATAPWPRPRARRNTPASAKEQEGNALVP